MCRTSCRLKQNRLEIRKVAYGKYHPRRVSTVLRHAARYIAAISGNVFAKLWLSSDTVEAVETWFQGIRSYAITDRYIGDIFPNRSDYAGCLMTYDYQRRMAIEPKR